ncbi:MAG: hypothetical protein EPN85_00750 [Bacteroidetes bacterium]|nr:MAG: hypothetical protein EPN85_00750 [Bacteroidota bacterium]
MEEYLWGDKSVIDKIRADKKLSYDDACISVENEFREMNRSILSDEKYRDVFLEKWLQASCRQLYNFEAGRIPPLLEGYSLYPNIVWHYDRELLAYRYSRQSRDLMDYSLINSIQNYNVVLSILYILVVITTVSIKNRHTISGFAFLFIVILFGYLINVFVCEFFSNPSERFSGRMIWLFPLIAGIDLLSRIRSYWSRKQTD